MESAEYYIIRHLPDGTTKCIPFTEGDLRNLSKVCFSDMEVRFYFCHEDVEIVYILKRVNMREFSIIHSYDASDHVKYYTQVYREHPEHQLELKDAVRFLYTGIVVITNNWTTSDNMDVFIIRLKHSTTEYKLTYFEQDWSLSSV